VVHYYHRHLFNRPSLLELIQAGLGPQFYSTLIYTSKYRYQINHNCSSYYYQYLNAVDEIC